MGGEKELESSWPQPKVGPGSQHQPLAPALGFPSPLAFPHRLGATSSFPLARGLPYLHRPGRLHTTFLCCERIATPHGITASAWAETADKKRGTGSQLSPPVRAGSAAPPFLVGGPGPGSAPEAAGRLGSGPGADLAAHFPTRPRPGGTGR